MKPGQITSNPQWTYVSDGGDWVAFYKDGELKKCGHPSDPDEVFEMLGITLDRIHPDPTSPQPFPKLLKDVIPFDEEAEKKRRAEKEKQERIATIEKEISDRLKKLDSLRGVKK